MPFRAHFACFLGVLFAVLVGVTAYQLTHPRGAQSEAGPDSLLGQSVSQCGPEGQDEVLRFDSMLLARAEERRQLIVQLCDGSLTLFETAAEFRRLNSLPNPCTYDVLTRFPGATRNEKLCRQVICWLGAVISDWPLSQRMAVVERVETELRDHLECNGKVVLPGD